MPRIRIVSTGVAAALVVALAAGGAMARTAASDPPGKPLALLAGLRPPHESKTHKSSTHDSKTNVHAKSARRSGKHVAAKKLAARKPPSKKLPELAATETAQPSSQPALPVNVSPVADATPPTAVATVAPPQAPMPDNDATPSKVEVGGQTVQIASPDELNAIDLAVDDRRDAATDADSDLAPAAQAVLSAPVVDDKNPVGSASWIAQVLAALGGAAAAGAVAWFLIGAGPVRMYG